MPRRLYRTLMTGIAALVKPRRRTVLDALYIGIIFAFFVICWAFTKACDRM
ncbi:MAG: hypothetical protein ACRD2G_01650 [Terriglobia bacterium]